MHLASVIRTTRTGPANIGSVGEMSVGGLATSSRGQIGLLLKAENNKNNPIVCHTQKFIHMDNQLNMKVKTIKQLEENIGAYFHYFRQETISET